MKLVEVINKRTAKQFLNVARRIYKNDNIWVCPQDSAINSIFDPKKNIFYTHGDAIRWILFNDNGKLIGRVAAFINEKKAFNFEQPTGGMGFFECINDEKAAFILFDKCREWLRERGMKAVDGPINFGENDNFWGLLVEGFISPSHGMNYNHPYYVNFFENYGFSKYFEQVTNNLDIRKPFPERFWKIAKWICEKPDYNFEHFKYSKSDKYIHDIKEIYDNAWRFHENFTPLEIKDMEETLREAKPILEEEFIWIVYNKEKPIAFLIMLPDVNQILKHLNGKMHLLNKLKFLYYKKRNTITRTRVTVMGVIPEFQKYGIESGIFWHLKDIMDKRPHYNEFELSWVGDYNPKMQALHKSTGSKFAKRHITYRKLFDDSESKRSSIISLDIKAENRKFKKNS